MHASKKIIYMKGINNMQDENRDNTVKSEFYNVLYRYVADNYGESEADDPSYNLEDLARELADKFYRIKDKWELDCIAEDVASVAEDHDIELTDKELYAIANEYRYSEAYCAMDRESIYYFIKREKENENGN